MFRVTYHARIDVEDVKRFMPNLMIDAQQCNIDGLPPSPYGLDDPVAGLGPRIVVQKRLQRIDWPSTLKDAAVYHLTHFGGQF